MMRYTGCSRSDRFLFIQKKRKGKKKGTEYRNKEQDGTAEQLGVDDKNRCDHACLKYVRVIGTRRERSTKTKTSFALSLASCFSRTYLHRNSDTKAACSGQGQGEEKKQKKNKAMGTPRSLCLQLLLNKKEQCALAFFYCMHGPAHDFQRRGRPRKSIRRNGGKSTGEMRND
jgi:hypothetical protein